MDGYDYIGGSPLGRRMSILLAFVVALVSPIPAQKASNSSVADGPPAYTVSEAYSVYSSILRGGAYLVNIETEPHEMCRVLGREPDQSMREAMVDYVKVNHSKFVLLPIFFGLFPGSRPSKLVRRQDLPPVNPVNNPEFGGPDLWSFSAVGFNRDKTFALTYYEHSGTGAILVLQKIGGRWTVLEPRAICRWIS